MDVSAELGELLEGTPRRLVQGPAQGTLDLRPRTGGGTLRKELDGPPGVNQRTLAQAACQGPNGQHLDPGTVDEDRPHLELELEAIEGPRLAQGPLGSALAAHEQAREGRGVVCGEPEVLLVGPGVKGAKIFAPKARHEGVPALHPGPGLDAHAHAPAEEAAGVVAELRVGHANRRTVALRSQRLIGLVGAQDREHQGDGQEQGRGEGSLHLRLIGRSAPRL